MISRFIEVNKPVLKVSLFWERVNWVQAIFATSFLRVDESSCSRCWAFPVMMDHIFNLQAQINPFSLKYGTFAFIWDFFFIAARKETKT